MAPSDVKTVSSNIRITHAFDYTLSSKTIVYRDSNNVSTVVIDSFPFPYYNRLAKNRR